MRAAMWLTLAVTLTAASPASADSFQFLSKDDKGGAVFLDLDTVTREAAKVRAWLVVVNGQYLAGKPTNSAYHTIQYEIGCDNHRNRPTAMSVYGVEGELLIADTVGGEEGEIELGTIEQIVFQLLCRGPEGQPKLVKADSPLSLAQGFRAANLGTFKINRK